VTKSRDRKWSCPEAVQTGTRFCACPVFFPRFFLSSSNMTTEGRLTPSGFPWVYATGSCATYVVTESHEIPWKCPWGVLYDVHVPSGRVTDVTSGHVTSGSTTQHLRKYDFVRTHILLISFNHNPFRKGNSTTDHLFLLQSFSKTTFLWIGNPASYI
jgi:hypothetical protein